MHTRIYRGYILAWGDPKDHEFTQIATILGEWLSDAESGEDAERLVDEWLDAK